ncbi:MAG: Gfo/Idh/MocA family oxidoreductase [Deltaproteobacteria bacterium]|nr:Gfo/Idh/MocA family oxidoreductase [Deltaproteobacteria bacterium]
MNSEFCLVGAGQMAIDYAKVLQSLKQPFVVVGRGATTAKTFESQTGLSVKHGGVKEFLARVQKVPQQAIVAVGVEQLSSVTSVLIESGVRRILVEKPGGLNISEIRNLASLADRRCAEIYVAYNRRFYASVLTAKRLIAEDGGVTSFHFEFTEWPHVIEKLPGEMIKREWFLANSTHVIDMAFFLGGKPKEISSFVSGSLEWHPSGAQYSGAGISVNGALFSYCADWTAPGRWNVEIMTRKRRFIFRPLEKLQVQLNGSVTITDFPLQDQQDHDFKPGLYRQTKAFLSGDVEDLLSIAEHVSNLVIYEKMNGKA